jgi:hypothetical protein
MLTNPVDLIETTAAGPRRLGSFLFDDQVGLVVFDTQMDELDSIFERILQQQMLTEDNVLVDADQFPLEWLKALPRNLTGAYLRAQKAGQ